MEMFVSVHLIDGGIQLWITVVISQIFYIIGGKTNNFKMRLEQKRPKNVCLAKTPKRQGNIFFEKEPMAVQRARF